MSDRWNRRRISLVAILICCAGVVGWACSARGEGGEPRYFAINNARIVPVSGPVIENGTVVVAKGLIQAVGTNVTIPPEAWVIEGKGLTVYPGLIDAGTNLGLPSEEATDGSGGGRGEGERRRRVHSRGRKVVPELRPGASWRMKSKPTTSASKSWRSAGFTTALTVPEGGIFPGQAAVIDLAGERAGDYVVRAMPLCRFPSSRRADFSVSPIR